MKKFLYNLGKFQHLTKFPYRNGFSYSILSIVADSGDFVKKFFRGGCFYEQEKNSGFGRAGRSE